MADSAIVKSEFTASTADEAAAALAATFSQNQLRLSSGRDGFRYSQTRYDLGLVQIDTLHNTLTADLIGEPIGSVILCRITDQTLELDVGNGPEVFGRGDLLLAMHPDRGYRSRMRGVSEQVVSADLALLRQVADDATVDRLLTDGAFGHHIPVGAARSWQHVVDYVATAIQTDTALATSSLVLDSIRRLIASTLLTTTVAPAATTIADRQDSTPANLRRAVAFIESNPDLDIGLNDIARAAYVTPRAVQLAFRKYLNTTPLAYLRRVRLDAAHHALQTADPDAGDTVTAIAAAWGFANSGRFAAQYRRAYGVLPSQTLRG